MPQEWDHHLDTYLTRFYLLNKCPRALTRILYFFQFGLFLVCFSSFFGTFSRPLAYLLHAFDRIFVGAFDQVFWIYTFKRLSIWFCCGGVTAYRGWPGVLAYVYLVLKPNSKGNVGVYNNDLILYHPPTLWVYRRAVVTLSFSVLSSSQSSTTSRLFLDSSSLIPLYFA